MTSRFRSQPAPFCTTDCPLHTQLCNRRQKQANVDHLPSDCADQIYTEMCWEWYGEERSFGRCTTTLVRVDQFKRLCISIIRSRLRNWGIDGMHIIWSDGVEIRRETEFLESIAYRSRDKMCWKGKQLKTRALKCLKIWILTEIFGRKVVAQFVVYCLQNADTLYTH